MAGQEVSKMRKAQQKKNSLLDRKFIFYNSGFNLRSTDVAASIGLSQLKDLNRFIKIRNINRKKILTEINKNHKVKTNFHVLKENSNVKASWFGIPIIISKKLNVKKITKYLEKMGIETRPIISGNF